MSYLRKGMWTDLAIETGDQIQGIYNAVLEENQGMSELAGKYRTFKLVGEGYAIEILKVKEII